MNIMVKLRQIATLALLAAAPTFVSAQEGAAPARAAGPAQAQAPTPAFTVGPPVQRIESATAVSTEAFGAISTVRELPDGRVLVNDPTRRRLLLMDTTLTRFETLLDSLPESSNSYGPRAGGLIPSRGDSTMFVDPVSYSALVIDPDGRMVKVRSVWRARDVSYYVGTTGAFGWPGVDGRGRAVYRVPAINFAEMGPWVTRGETAYTTWNPDSAFLVAVDLNTREVDTLTTLRIPKSGSYVQPMNGGYSYSSVTNPLPSTDEWAVLPDGGVAVVRGQDYRVEYLNADGTWTSSAKLPFEWQRVTDEEKKRMVDSVHTSQLQARRADFVSATIRWVNQFRQKYPQNFRIPEGYVPPVGFGRDWQLPAGITFPTNYIYGCAAGEEPKAVAATPGGAPPPVLPSSGTTVMSSGMGSISVATGGMPAMPAGAMPSCIPAPVVLTGGTIPQPPMLRRPAVVETEHLPDYRPPFPAGGSVRADMEGNLWVRINPARPVPGGPVYDIVSRQGELVNRMQIPPGYAIVGFGRGKVVFLSMRDASGIHLARVRLR